MIYHGRMNKPAVMRLRTGLPWNRNAGSDENEEEGLDGALSDSGEEEMGSL